MAFTWLFYKNSFFASSSGNIDDFGTHVGFAILLFDDKKMLKWLFYASYKCSIVVLSFLERMTYAFLDCVDVAYSLLLDINNNSGK